MGLVDTHCHLQSQRFDVDRDAVLATSLERLDWLVVIGDDLEASREALTLCGPRVKAVVGIHPYHGKDWSAEVAAEVRELASRPGVVGLGETGLDYFNEFSPRLDQARAFEAQLEMACELNLPVVIHNREADADCHAILSNFADRLPGCIMHCFGSGPDWAAKFLELGFYISFAGNVTFSKAIPLQESAKIVPLDRLLVETDAPYLAPIPLRGKRCEPWHVLHTAAFLAELKGVPEAELAARTTENARRVYNVNLEVHAGDRP